MSNTERSESGLAHVATVSFLASRAAPSLQFFFALGGGMALARSAQQRGARTGYGTALAFPAQLAGGDRFPRRVVPMQNHRT